VQVIMLVDNPILNSPFDEPTRYWAYEEGQPVLKEGRRPVVLSFQAG
jgi:type III restriction enzyme